MFSSRRVGYLDRTFWRKLGRKKEGIYPEFFKRHRSLDLVVS
jgi:hypothetical protein